MSGLEHKTAVIFPGQGAQKIGMGKDFAESSPSARRIFDVANDVLGFDLATICFDGPAEKLERTDIQQPAIFTTSAAIWSAFEDLGVDRSPFSHFGGLSLGEYTALYAAGVISFEDGLKLVHRRGQLMQEAALAAPSGMVSVIGADEATVEELCRVAKKDDVLGPANFNCPGQIVISGSRGACDRALEAAGKLGCRAIALSVAGAFHSTLMGSAAAGLAPVLSDTEFCETKSRVVANVDACYHTDVDGMRASLRRQITEPVLWQKCVEKMIEDGVETFAEIGPGRVLTGLMRKIDRRMRTLNLSTVASFKETAAAFSQAAPSSERVSR